MIKLFIILLIIGCFVDRKNFKYFAICCGVLFLMVSLRHETCYYDTLHYIDGFRLVNEIDFSQIPNFFDKDISFWYLSKFIGFFSKENYTIWLSVLCFPYFLAFCMLIRGFSEDLPISLLVFCALGFFFFSFTGLRQNLALSFIMIALFLLLKGRWVYFLISVLIASLFHITAISFLVAYPLSKIKFSKKVALLYLVAVVFLLLEYNNDKIAIINYFVSFISIGDRFSVYLDGDNQVLNYTGLIRQVVVFFISFILLYKARKVKNYSLLIQLSIIGIMVQSLSSTLAEMFRISMYFSIANILLFANAISSITSASKLLIRKIVCCILIVYIIYTTWKLDYYFFFQDVPSEIYINLAR